MLREQLHLNRCAWIPLLCVIAHVPTEEEGRRTLLRRYLCAAEKRHTSLPIHCVNDTRTRHLRTGEVAGVSVGLYLGRTLLSALHDPSLLSISPPSLPLLLSYWSHLLPRSILQVQHHTGTCWWDGSIADMLAHKSHNCPSFLKRTSHSAQTQMYPHMQMC